MRFELIEAVMREAFGFQRQPREVVALIEKFARENGIDETKLAHAVGRFWGRYFRELEVLKEWKAGR